MAHLTRNSADAALPFQYRYTSPQVELSSTLATGNSSLNLQVTLVSLPALQA